MLRLPPRLRSATSGRPAETPMVAQRTPATATPPAEVLRGGPAAATPSAELSRIPRLPRSGRPRPVQPPADTEPQRLATAKPANEPSVLIDHKSPLLSVETIGPRKIVVGKEAAYEVLLQNSGDVAAEEVTVTVGLPDWAEVAGTSASTGEVHPVQQDHHDPCRWVLGRIEARSKEKLALKIIPRQSKPFELAVRWDFKQAPSQAMIEVQEPKLTMRLDGPREVVFGKREVYKLKLGNSGNGPAENVLLTLMPLNSGDTHPITHRLGTINAGDERSIEIELTARQAGNLTIRVEANGDGGSPRRPGRTRSGPSGRPADRRRRPRRAICRHAGPLQDPRSQSGRRPGQERKVGGQAANGREVHLRQRRDRSWKPPPTAARCDWTSSSCRRANSGYWR